MSKPKSLSTPAACAICLVVTACAAGPDFHAPAPPDVPTYTSSPQPISTDAPAGPGGGEQHFGAMATYDGAWWCGYGSPTIDKLVQSALQDSPGIAQAEAKLVQARQDYRAQSGATQWPEVDAAANAARQKIDPAAFGIGNLLGNRSVPPFNLYSAKVEVSYTLDLFGADRRALEALAAQVDYEAFERDAARQTLAGNVVVTALRRASLAKQIAVTQELLADQERQLDIADRRYQAGGISRMDLLDQRTQVEQTRASLPPLHTQLAQSDHQLAVYLGRPPAQLAGTAGDDPSTLDLDAISLPSDIPLAMPSAWARERPDIRASEALLHQASANVGAATANLYPQITLSGSMGPEAVRLGDWTNVWSIGAGITQPIFHGGALHARRDSAQAAYDAALASYRQTVLQGLQQVADALRALQQDAVEMQSRDDAHRDARAGAEIAARRYEAGGISQLALLDSQRQELQAVLDRTRIQAQRLADTAALFQALGVHPAAQPAAQP
jgi:NodT family efflux transporter outer membrane factor (OMF) lipoprotein